MHYHKLLLSVCSFIPFTLYNGHNIILMFWLTSSCQLIHISLHTVDLTEDNIQRYRQTRQSIYTVLNFDKLSYTLSKWLEELD